MEKEIYYDVLVVGGGNAALCAASSAHEHGAKVGILEKAPKEERGGNSAMTAHMRYVYNSVDDIIPLVPDITQKEIDGINKRLPKRTEEDLWNEIMRATGGQSDPELLKIHVSESYNTIKWLRDMGHTWVTDVENPTAANTTKMEGGGFGLQKRHFTFLEEKGVPVHYETSATKLIQDENRKVVGVEALTPEGPVTFKAGAVVLACGGFEANPEMRGRYIGPMWDTVSNRGCKFNTGDGLRMALDIGAMSYGSWTSCHASPQDLNRPLFSWPSWDSEGGREYNRYAYPFCVMVNINGERFVDEGEDVRGVTYAKMGRNIVAQPGGKAFQFFDAKSRRFGLLEIYDKYNATGSKADSLEELADEYGINKENLLKTIREFNEAIQPGPMNPNPLVKDGKHTKGINPPKRNFAYSIDEPPFECYPCINGITFTFGGLKVNPNTTQVEHVSGGYIPGLYTTGEMLGGLWHWSYASGSGMMAGATFGRIAGKYAAKEALDK